MGGTVAGGDVGRGEEQDEEAAWSDDLGGCFIVQSLGEGNSEVVGVEIGFYSTMCQWDRHHVMYDKRPNTYHAGSVPVALVQRDVGSRVPRRTKSEGVWCTLRVSEWVLFVCLRCFILSGTHRRSQGDQTLKEIQISYNHQPEEP